MVTTRSRKELGINGGLAKKGHTGIPDMNTIGVSSVDKFSKMIQETKVARSVPKTPIPGIGWFANCQDTEGNTFGKIEQDPHTK
jgi:uncharacterized protein